MEKKDNTKGKVKGYFMYEKEKQRENHLIVLLVYTFFSLILTGESLLLGWEVGAIVNIFLILALVAGGLALLYALLLALKIVAWRAV